MATRETTPGRVETSVESVSKAIKGAMPVLDETDRQIALAVHRLMSLGKPVEVGRPLTTRITQGVGQ